MPRVDFLEYESVEFIPEQLGSGKIYVSFPYDTTAHLCCCGCGNKVVAPIGPTDWRVSSKKGLVTLYPSIGNWSFQCQSHYWIRDGKVIWARKWSREQIELGRATDHNQKKQFFEKRNLPWWRKLLRKIVGE